MTRKIIYIISDVRSGSTLLENILSKSDEMLSVGELHHLDSHVHKGEAGKRWNWNCSCGKSIIECEFWSQVINALQSKGFQEIEKTFIDPPERIFKQTNPKCNWQYSDANRKTLNLLQHIYASIFETTDTKVIIDSSKTPFQGLAVYSKVDFDVKIIYLKRDIRAVTLSKHKWNNKYGIKRGKYKILMNSKLYDLQCRDAFNKVKEQDRIAISYEDLATSPQKIIDRITEKFDLPPVKVPEYMYLENDHTVGGTPTRFEKRKIKFDDSWKSGIAKMPLFKIVGGILDRI